VPVFGARPASSAPGASRPRALGPRLGWLGSRLGWLGARLGWLGSRLGWLGSRLGGRGELSLW